MRNRFDQWIYVVDITFSLNFTWQFFGKWCEASNILADDRDMILCHYDMIIWIILE